MIDKIMVTIIIHIYNVNMFTKYGLIYETDNILLIKREVYKWSHFEK